MGKAADLGSISFGLVGLKWDASYPHNPYFSYGDSLAQRIMLPCIARNRRNQIKKLKVLLD